MFMLLAPYYIIVVLLFTRPIMFSEMNRDPSQDKSVSGASHWKVQCMTWLVTISFYNILSR